MAGTTRPNSPSRQSAAKSGEALSIADAFAAERTAFKGLMAARSEHDFARMATLVPALLEARTCRLTAALTAKRITIIDSPIGEDVTVSKGAYLVEPPQVGADARRLRLAAFEQNVPAAVLCREPLTRIKLLPVVAIAPGATVRVKVHPPKNLDKPDMPWFIATLQALGDMAIETIDASMPAERRVDALLERLDAAPEHEGLHHALQQACIEAAAEREQARSLRAARASAKSGDSNGTDADPDADEDVDGEDEAA